MPAFRGIGTFHLEKDGTSSAHLWVNFGGSALSEFTANGTTTVNADCTLTQTFEGVPSPAHCVVFANRTKMWCVYEPPGTVTVTLERIGRP